MCFGIKSHLFVITKSQIRNSVLLNKIYLSSKDANTSKSKWWRDSEQVRRRRQLSLVIHQQDKQLPEGWRHQCASWPFPTPSLGRHLLKDSPCGHLPFIDWHHFRGVKNLLNLGVVKYKMWPMKLYKWLLMLRSIWQNSLVFNII